MRAHHMIAVIVILVIGLAAKQLFYPPNEAKADLNVAPSPGMNVLQMHIDHPNRNDHPNQQMHDMTFVFSNET